LKSEKGLGNDFDLQDHDLIFKNTCLDDLSDGRLLVGVVNVRLQQECKDTGKKIPLLRTFA